MSTQQQTPMAQRSLQKLLFNHKDMDYYLLWILGRQIFDGSDEQECMDTAAKITDGDPLSWQKEWLALAQQVEAGAREARERGEVEAARKAFLRACTYYRAPMFMMDPKSPSYKERWQQQRACFRAAMELFSFPIEAIDIPFQGKRLDGYSWKIGETRQKIPTLLIVGGMETFAEDCYFIVGSEAARRGYQLITVDLPGQGTNPDQGLYLEARMKPAVNALLDYALARQDVDAERLALFGFSWGGHIVLQGAQDEPRIKALVANPPMPDVFKAAQAQQSGHGRNDPVNKLIFEQLAWRFGVQIREIFPRLVKGFQYLFHGRANCKRILCPALFMAGEGEAEITLNLARQCFSQLPNPQKKLAILTREQGGEAHCQINNLSLLNQVIFDWLEAVFQ